MDRSKSKLHYFTRKPTAIVAVQSKDNDCTIEVNKGDWIILECATGDWGIVKGESFHECYEEEDHPEEKAKKAEEKVPLFAVGDRVVPSEYKLGGDYTFVSPMAKYIGIPQTVEAVMATGEIGYQVSGWMWPEAALELATEERAKLTPTQRLCLRMLRVVVSMTARELKDHSTVSISTIRKALNVLLALEFVTRKRDHSGRYLWMKTKTGREFLKEDK